MEEKNKNLTDEQLSQQLRKSKGGKWGGMLLSLLGGVIVFAGIVQGGNLVLIIAGVVILALGQTAKGKSREQAGRQTFDALAPDIVSTVFDNIQMDPAPHILDAKDTNIPNVETVEDLKNTVKERLASAKQAQAENAADEKLFDELTSNVKIDMPDALVEDEVNGQIQQMAAQIQQYGISFTQYLKMMGKTVEDVKNDYRENAEKSVKLRLTLNKIAEVENLEATDEDVEAQYHDLATQYGMEVEKIKPLVSVDMIKQDIKTTKAYNFVKDNAAKA